ncbi:MAG: DUF2007 domain-containing protein [Nitrospirota bacterium]
MVKLMVSQSLVEIEAIRSRLEDEGISCFIKNQHTSTLAGEVPFVEVFPELWLTRDDDLPKAQEVLGLWKNAGGARAPDWTCASCGERHGDQYTECWQCGAARDQPQTGPTKTGSQPRKERAQDVSGSRVGFGIGVLFGAALALLGSSLMHYFNAQIVNVQDRNGDGKLDSIYTNETLSPVSPQYATRLKEDDNFDGVFDALYFFDSAGLVTRGEIDRDQDGKPDMIESFQNGTLSKVDFLNTESGAAVKRIFYYLSKREREDIDLDGDGKFERTTFFNDYELPESVGTAATQ